MAKKSKIGSCHLNADIGIGYIYAWQQYMIYVTHMYCYRSVTIELWQHCMHICWSLLVIVQAECCCWCCQPGRVLSCTNWAGWVSGVPRTCSFAYLVWQVDCRKWGNMHSCFLCSTVLCNALYVASVCFIAFLTYNSLYLIWVLVIILSDISVS